MVTTTRPTAKAATARRSKEGQIAAAARGLFLAQGFAGTSMDTVAAEARVSKRTLYQYFPSKEALFVSVVQRELATLLEALGSAHRADGAPDLERIAIQWMRAAFAPEMVALFRSVIAEAERLPALTRSLDEAVMKPVEAEVGRALSALAAKSGRALEDPAAATDAFVGLLLGARQIRLLLALGPELDDEAQASLARARVALFLKAFGLNAPVA